MTNIDPDVADQIYKLFSMILCANTLGQVGSWVEDSLRQPIACI